MSAFSESVVEQAALAWFESLGYRVIGGPSIAPGEPGEERRTYADVVLEGRLREALARLNPNVSAEGLEEAFRKLTRITSPSLVDANHELHHYLVNGVSVEYLRADGTLGYDPVRVIDFDVPENNDWLVVNQLTVTEGGHKRRPDVVVFLNGLPIAVVELKNAASENATIWGAFEQLQTYKHELPSLFVFNELLVISDGLDARLGTLSSQKERFLPWRTIEGEALAPKTVSQLEVLIRGAFEKRRLLDLLRYFLVFEDDGANPIKKVAGYHQFHAVARALEATVEAGGRCARSLRDEKKLRSSARSRSNTGASLRSVPRRGAASASTRWMSTSSRTLRKGTSAITAATSERGASRCSSKLSVRSAMESSTSETCSDATTEARFGKYW
jgi:type I restriction enzyme, R subunit